MFEAFVGCERACSAHTLLATLLGLAALSLLVTGALTRAAPQLRLQAAVLQTAEADDLTRSAAPLDREDPFAARSVALFRESAPRPLIFRLAHPPRPC